ncbi:FAD-dependent oxidoreductase [Roseicella aquatilis]|uniref:FAD-dependent monooxygenase n=1 Tax=Roseicella aquatilis TaxID=2527868 RepID=A0A4R4DKV9_9PROT|nr:FAD-dependent oxidoreductase [Roseicella aquatilis]TCZ61122.1 FAD-dependent monooxygenase [Roseicella aquatilis]
MPERLPVLIVGAGPVGLVAAVALAREGVPVTVLEAEPALGQELRASTFHAPTLDLLDGLGAAAPLVAQGLVARTVQYRSHAEGVFAAFDFALLADLTRHPYRLQAEQWRLTRILADLLRDQAGVNLRLGAAVVGCTDHGDAVEVVVADGERLRGSYAIGADGAHSAVRRAAGIAFAGFTWPERFLVLSTGFDFAEAIPGLAPVSYFAEPEGWFFLLQVPGLWRAMVPVPAEVADATTLTDGYARACLGRIVPGREDCPVRHRTLYRVHQRVAETFRQGRVLLAGDAAHINNPLGGMGLNGGVHDACNLAAKLAAVWRGEADASLLDRYDRQRRGVTVEYVQRATIANKQGLEAREPGARATFRARLTEAASSPERARAWLLGASMIASLRRAEEIE